MTGRAQVLVPGGSFRMGSVDYYPEERPVTEVTVDELWVDEHPVTNAEFRRFVKATGHISVAERAPDPWDFPGADPDLMVPGSQMFTGTSGPVPFDDWTRWWSWVPGASWRHPHGPGSTLHGLELHPVVHVGWEDAAAYAGWAGARLPTEAEWEHAARGGLEDAAYAWGDEMRPGGKTMANTWQGHFPYENLWPPKLARTSPIRTFPPNGYGLYDVTGNVWEWTATTWIEDHDAIHAEPAPSCCLPTRTVTEQARFVTKGGSHLCAPEYCHRYRPAARQGHGARDTTNHVGFRCVRDPN